MLLLGFMILVSRIIWQPNSKNYRESFVAITQSIELKIFLGTQEPIMYRLVVRNLRYVVYFSVLIFRTTFGDQKVWPTRRTFWVNHYLEIMFFEFSGVLPNGG